MMYLVKPRMEKMAYFRAFRREPVQTVKFHDHYQILQVPAISYRYLQEFSDVFSQEKRLSE